MKYLTADEARDLAKLNSEECQLVQNILKEIDKAARKGEYLTFYYVEDYKAGVRAGQELTNLGYKVRVNNSAVRNEFVMFIYW